MFGIIGFLGVGKWLWKIIFIVIYKIWFIIVDDYVINNFLYVEYVISLILLSFLEDVFDLDLGCIQCLLEFIILGKIKW